MTAHPCLPSRLVWLAACALLMAGCASAPPEREDGSTWNRVQAPPSMVSPAESRAEGPLTAPESVATQTTPRAARGPQVRPAAQYGDITNALAAQQASGQAVTQLSAPADLWERMRRGFAMQNLDTDLVRDKEQFYAGKPDYIGRMTERSRKYLFHIVEELERRNMPTELALLPFVESAFNPQAISSAKAMGMWQFMPATGKTFELKQNAFRDDRRDVLASTRAALDYLQKLYGMFGDWHLALAAYNWGEGSVGRAIAKNQRAGLGTAYTDLNMPAETRHYVPKFQAIKNIVNEPTRFNTALPVIENHPFFQSVTVTRDIDVDLAARLAEVSLEDFRALNPSANRPVILAAAKPQILLPWDQAAVFEKNVETYKGPRMASWTAWVLPANLKTAEAARRAGMAEAHLREVNHIPPHQVIKAGSTLVVPRGAKIEEDVSEHVAENGQLGLAPEQLARRTTVKLKKTETVAALAKRYRVSAQAVAEWNQIGAAASFASGQQVVLFLPVRGKVSGSAVAKASKKGSRMAVAKSKGKGVKVAKR